MGGHHNSKCWTYWSGFFILQPDCRQFLEGGFDVVEVDDELREMV